MPAIEINTKSARIASIDILRGIIMVVMALDHTRDYFSAYKGDPLDFDQVSVFMFFTRWITHFCAPVFVFLSGTSAYLSGRSKSKKETALWLLTRGIWLVILEVTIVRLGWQFNIDYSLIFLQVIWAIGWSMIFLSAVVFLPLPVIAGISLIVIAGHNTLDSVHIKDMSSTSILWTVLHEPGRVNIATHTVFVLYPLVPWIAVMSIGYCFGVVLQKAYQGIMKILYQLGGSMIVAFIIIRWINVYGDPQPWHMQSTWWKTALDFIRCQKYPPSLLYLLMTLGPAIFSLPLLEKISSTSFARIFTVYGRVPMFYYILHIYLIHTLALITGLVSGAALDLFTSNGALFDPSRHWGFSLPVVYAYWISTLAILYFPCRWYMRIKMQHKKWWLSYL
jgi:uncharacterized membrane protein